MLDETPKSNAKSDIEREVGVFVNLLRSPETAVRDLGWDAAGELCNGKPENVERVWRAVQGLFEHEEDDLAIESAIYALGHIAGNDEDEVIVPEVREWMLRHADSQDPNVRLAIARNVASLRGKPLDSRVDETLIALTRDGDEEVRNWATFGLAQAVDLPESPAIVEALLERLEDPHAETRNEAILGLARRGKEAVVDAVVAELEDGAPWSHSVEAAGLIGAATFLPLLQNLRSCWETNLDLLEKAIRRCDPVQRAAFEASAAMTVSLLLDALARAGAEQAEVRLLPDEMDHDVNIEWVDATGVRHESWYGFEYVMMRDDVQDDPERAAAHMVRGLDEL